MQNTHLSCTVSVELSHCKAQSKKADSRQKGACTFLAISFSTSSTFLEDAIHAFGSKACCSILQALRNYFSEMPVKDEWQEASYHYSCLFTFQHIYRNN